MRIFVEEEESAAFVTVISRSTTVKPLTSTSVILAIWETCHGLEALSAWSVEVVVALFIFVDVLTTAR